MGLIHFSDEPFELRRGIKKQRTGFKPIGLWLSDGAAWSGFAASEMASHRYRYKTIVSLSRSTHLLRIALADIDKVQHDFGRKLGKYTVIDWPKLALNGFDGVDYRPVMAQLAKRPASFRRAIHIDHHWIAMVDIPCVVLWNTHKVWQYRTDPA